MNRNINEKYHKNQCTVSLTINKMILLNNPTQFTTIMLGHFPFKSVSLIDLKSVYLKPIFLRLKVSSSSLLNNPQRRRFKLRKDHQFVKRLVMLKDMTFQMFKPKTGCRTSFCTTKIDLHSN